MKLKIDKEFQSLIPAMSEDEREQLENNMVADGCRDPLVHWGGVIVDGHNRFEICERRSIEYRTVEREFTDRDAAKYWIIVNQLGRRNLTDMVRVELALKLKPYLEKEAKQKSSQNLQQNSESLKSDAREDAGRTDAKIAGVAGVGKDTVRNVEAIVANAVPEVQQAAREGKVSISAAAKVAKKSKDEQKKAAAKGAAGIKAAAKKEIPEDGCSDEVELEPWQKVAAGVDEIISTLRGVTGDMRTLFKVDGQEIKEKAAKSFSWMMTVGAVNHLIRDLENYKPIGVNKKNEIITKANERTRRVA